MTLPQGLSFAVVGGMMILFAWDRWRYDVVALAALMAAVACGIVPAKHAFDGFGNPLLPLIAAVLVMSRAVAKSGVIETGLRPLLARLHWPSAQVLGLSAVVAFLSAVVKNVGALAIFLPPAIQLAERQRRTPAYLLMPMSFAALIGGTMTLIGTSPNLIVSSVRQELYGAPYRMFDFLPVGLGLTLLVLAFLALGWRLIPERKGHATAENLFRIEDYLAEARVPADSPSIGKTVAELEALADREVTVAAVIRENLRRYVPSGHWALSAGDVLVLQSDPHALERLVSEARLELVLPKEGEAERRPNDDLATVEAVVGAGSIMLGASPAELRLRRRFGVVLLAVSQRGRAAGTRLRDVRFRLGDVVALEGRESDIAESLSALGLLPLAERRLALGRPRHAAETMALLLAAVALSASGTAPPAIAFTGAAVLVALLRILPLRDIYAAIEWPILVLLGALIPVGEAVQHTGASALVAQWLSHVAFSLPPAGVIAGLILVTMLVTPFLHHAAAVIVMGPIAASLASRLGFHGDPCLMAVAIGASCDFLTPIGHQCNTLVMGPGGYRFGDYWRLGLPLTCLVAAAGALLIPLVWPLR